MLTKQTGVEDKFYAMVRETAAHALSPDDGEEE
jgi:hypothetical protein